MSTCMTLGTMATAFVDDTEVCVRACVVHEPEGLAHTCPGCSVMLATNDYEDHEPKTGCGAAACEGLDAITTVRGSTAVEVSEVVEVSVVDGTDVEATNTYMTKLSDECSAAVSVKKIGCAAIVEEYLTTGGSGEVAVLASVE